MKSTIAILVLLFAVSNAGKFVVRPTNPIPTAPVASDVECPDSLCKWLRVGSIFRLSEDKPNYFVTCTNGGSVCRRCQDGLVFNNRNTACVRDIRGSSTTTTTPEPTTTTTTTEEPTTTTTTEEPTTTTEEVSEPGLPCPNSLCKWRRNGALFRYSNQQPEYFVHCSNHIASCKKCAEPGTQFNNKFLTCLRRTVPVKGW